MSALLVPAPVKERNKAGAMKLRSVMEEGQSQLLVIQNGMDADGEFQLAAEILRQAMTDAAEGIMCGLVDEELRPLGKQIPQFFTQTSVAKCSGVEAVDAGRFFTDGRADIVLGILEFKMQRRPFCLDWVKRQIRKIAYENKPRKVIVRGGSVVMRGRKRKEAA